MSIHTPALGRIGLLSVMLLAVGLTACSPAAAPRDGNPTSIPSLEPTATVSPQHGRSETGMDGSAEPAEPTLTATPSGVSQPMTDGDPTSVPSLEPTATVSPQHGRSETGVDGSAEPAEPTLTATPSGVSQPMTDGDPTSVPSLEPTATVSPQHGRSETGVDGSAEPAEPPPTGTPSGVSQLMTGMESWIVESIQAGKSNCVIELSIEQSIEFWSTKEYSIFTILYGHV